MTVRTWFRLARVALWERDLTERLPVIALYLRADSAQKGWNGGAYEVVTLYTLRDYQELIDGTLPRRSIWTHFGHGQLRAPLSIID